MKKEMNWKDELPQEICDFFEGKKKETGKTESSSKPEQKPSQPESKPEQNSSKPQTKPEQKPSKPQHTHTWKEVTHTINHEEVGHNDSM